ncbi:glycosyl transferase [Chroococcidiopsis sp. CCALA 051]|uniref:glycosyltransferase n=1 Tax=Chroococcidiopsis sp. CCALA 051 TaxID=869949 RepID=UPI000D0E10D8|nr:glycosyltransferase [Chroococcidiopsis sp. CCALA 051]PSM50225.1 glycosyl transferase [Chroococcidiopsis sp. CCALA 051]
MTHEQPFFSIIIPTYNRPERLANCLQSIAQLNYPPDRFEVIVVDDGSEIPIEPVVASLRKQLNLTAIAQQNSGPANARNSGATRARGKFLVFTDDDCMPAPEWLKTLEVRFKAAPHCLVGGRTLNALPDNLYSTASQVLIDFLYEYYNADRDRSSFFASNNLALPAERFHSLGGFDTTFPLAAGEDREFCDRWLQHGYQMIYAPEAQVYHAHKLTLYAFWRQHYNYGRGAFCFHQVRARRNMERIKVEPLSFYFNLLKYPFSQGASQPALAIATLFMLSQIANVSGFFWGTTSYSR